MMQISRRFDQDALLRLLRGIILLVLPLMFWIFVIMIGYFVLSNEGYRNVIIEYLKTAAAENDPKNPSPVIGGLIFGGIAFAFVAYFFGIRPIIYSERKEGPEADGGSTAELRDIREIREQLSELKGSTDNTITEKLRKSTEEITKKIEDNLQKTLDLSDPDKLFHATRQRLMSESTRITKISLRNLIWGGAFSVAALFVLAYPMFVQPTFTPSASSRLLKKPGRLN